MATPNTSRRLELDSLRGLAALSVVFCHFLNVVPQVFDASPGGWAVRLIRDTPLHLFWAGSEAVIFFFVLSGFVLSIPFFSKPPRYEAFLIRRICRIWLPYLAAVTLAFLAYSLFHRDGEAPWLSTWFNSVWRTPLTREAIIKHVLLVVSFDNGAFNPVLWSLAIEMRISILFPLLMLVIARSGFRVAMLGALVCYVLGRGVLHYSAPLIDWSDDYFLTLMYVYLFVLGAYLAWHIDALACWFRSLGRPARYAMLLTGVLAYTNSFWLVHFPFGSLVQRLIGQFITAAGVAILILIGSASGRVNSCLTRKPLVFLGRISYSLYLVHAIVLLSLVHALQGALPLWIILPLAFVGACVASTILYYMVEEPSMLLGRRLTSPAKPNLSRSAELPFTHPCEPEGA